MTDARRNNTSPADIETAARLYIRRKYRQEHPSGEFDLGGRWNPSSHERQLCCDVAPKPSRAHPYRLIAHCRSLDHIAALLGIEDTAALRRRARELEAESVNELVRLHRATLRLMPLPQLLDFVRAHGLDLTDRNTLIVLCRALAEVGVRVQSLRRHFEDTPPDADDLSVEPSRDRSISR